MKNHSVRSFLKWLIIVTVIFVTTYVTLAVIQDDRLHPLLPKKDLMREMTSLPMPTGSYKTGEPILIDRLLFYNVAQSFGTAEQQSSIRSSYAEIFKSRGWRLISSGASGGESEYCKGSVLGVLTFMGNKNGASGFEIILTSGGSANVICN